MENLNTKKKILLVDDDKIQLTVSTMILKNNYELATARSGQEALRLVNEGFIPDLVLLDIIMPGMDGWETFQMLRSIDSIQSVPIIFITSLQNQNALKRAYELGASDFIMKPIIRMDLLNRIEKIFSGEKI
jgi:PleD family two-component response regulator